MRDDNPNDDRNQIDRTDSGSDPGSPEQPALPDQPVQPGSVDEAVPPPTGDPAPAIPTRVPVSPAIQTGPAEPADAIPLQEPFRGALNRTFAGRPLIVYLVLFAGAATLLLLLAIVWISATQDGNDRPEFCTPITALEAQQIILAGQVERMIVLVDDERPLSGLTGMRLEMTDETCREPQQGADARDDLYQIIGAAEFFNTFGEQRVRISYQRQEIPLALLSTSTPTPTATLPPTETATPSETPLVTPTDTPTETPTATATTSPEPATPLPTETETATATASSTATATATETVTPAIVPPAIAGSPAGASPEASPPRVVTPRSGLTPTP